VAEVSAGHPELLRLIGDEIRVSGPISFARFMDLALHHPAYGYYARGPERLGRGGDFFTASDVGSAFGACLARQLVEMDALLDRPATFRYVEHGAGRGLLAKDVRDALFAQAGDLARRLEVVLVERSPGMRAAAAERVPAAGVPAEGGAAPGGVGCVVAVELLDALPVHRLRRRGVKLREVVVALHGERLVEVETVPGKALTDWAETYGAAPDDGDEAEACLVLGPTLAGLAASIDRGFLVIVDFGHEAKRLFGPAHRRGTLLAYHRHRTNEDYLLRVGEQDLTAHVNLTALRCEAKAAGLALLGITTQDRFLIANGILDGLDTDDDGPVSATKRRLQAKQLIHPHGMGTIFKVAVLAKGMETGTVVRGVGAPFGPERIVDGPQEGHGSSSN
jgi:SAM-dependent MidA family methyltransferase